MTLLSFLYKNLHLVQEGCGNLVHHNKNVKKHGVRAIVAINYFADDTSADIELMQEDICSHAGNVYTNSSICSDT